MAKLNFFFFIKCFKVFIHLEENDILKAVMLKVYVKIF